MQPFSLSETASVPISLSVTWADGTSETIGLPLLSVEDFAPMLARETERRKAAGREAMKQVPANDAAARYRQARFVALESATLGDLVDVIQSGPGMAEVLEISRRKAGVPDAKWAKVKALMPAHEAMRMARALSTLWEQEDSAPAAQGPLPQGAAPPAEPTSQASSPGEGETPATESGGATTGSSTP